MFWKVEGLYSLQGEDALEVGIHNFSRHLDGLNPLLEKVFLLSSCFSLQRD